MLDAQFDSALARKLSTFMKLSREELAVLVDLQSKSRSVKRDQELGLLP
jgi:hypothetical protein